MSEVKKKPAPKKTSRAKKVKPTNEQIIAECKEECARLQGELQLLKDEHQLIKNLSLKLIPDIVEDEMEQIDNDIEVLKAKQTELESPPTE